jgi:hypothetical protein
LPNLWYNFGTVILQSDVHDPGPNSLGE